MFTHLCFINSKHKNKNNIGLHIQGNPILGIVTHDLQIQQFLLLFDLQTGKLKVD